VGAGNQHAKALTRGVDCERLLMQVSHSMLPVCPTGGEPALQVQLGCGCKVQGPTDNADDPAVITTDCYNWGQRCDYRLCGCVLYG
jgi:hypothetical protein